MIRHGAQLVFAYGRATVPRICVILRKSYGGAYIVMDSKTMGNDLCLAWPWAELAVMGAGQAAAILQRRATPEERAAFEADYAERLLNPYIAAERGYIDAVIEPAETRQVIAEALVMLDRQARGPRVPAARQHTALGRLLVGVERRHQSLRSHRAVSVLAHFLELGPVDPPIEPYAHPTASAHIGRPKEMVRLGLDQLLLRARRSRAPQMREVVIVMTVGPQHHELLLDEERRRAMAELLAHLRQ